MEAYYALIYVLLGASFFAAVARFSGILGSKKRLRVIYSERITDIPRLQFKEVLECTRVRRLAHLGVELPATLDEASLRVVRLMGLDSGCTPFVRDDLEWYLRSRRMVAHGFVVSRSGAIVGLLTARLYEKAVLEGEPSIGDIDAEIRNSMAHDINSQPVQARGKPRRTWIKGVARFHSRDEAARFISSLGLPGIYSATLMLSYVCGSLVVE